VIYLTAALYVMGAYLYQLHQQTILYFLDEDDYNPQKVLLNSLIWPVRVGEIMITFVSAKDDDDGK
jgi:hypothetical protein